MTYIPSFLVSVREPSSCAGVSSICARLNPTNFQIIRDNGQIPSPPFWIQIFIWICALWPQAPHRTTPSSQSFQKRDTSTSTSMLTRIHNCYGTLEHQSQVSMLSPFTNRTQGVRSGCWEGKGAGSLSGIKLVTWFVLGVGMSTFGISTGVSVIRTMKAKCRVTLI